MRRSVKAITLLALLALVAPVAWADGLMLCCASEPQGTEASCHGTPQPTIECCPDGGSTSDVPALLRSAGGAPDEPEANGLEGAGVTPSLAPAARSDSTLGDRAGPGKGRYTLFSALLL